MTQKKTFDPNEWLNKEPQKASKAKTKLIQSNSEEVERIIEQIESTKTDITGTYEAWRNVGFALADTFGENGRDPFHRVSKFHPEYQPAECDKQYDHCLKANGTGITLKTFFHLAKQAGIPLKHRRSSTPDQPKSNPAPPKQEELPTIPNQVFDSLPEFLQRITAVATSNEERDLLLLGSLVTISSTLPNVYGIYHDKKVFANLYLFITAIASAGKGRLIHCRQLVKPIHEHLKEEGERLRRQYEIEMNEYNNQKKDNPNVEKPDKPPMKLLFIPANSSSTGVFQLLYENEGRGLIFETEGDTLANIFQKEYGNYSDGFRNAFQHETISYYRRTDHEYVDLENPKLSTVLSGTPNQVQALIPNAENGLFSRFLFYHLKIQPVWADVFATNSEEGLDEYFLKLGEEFYDLYQQLLGIPPIRFDLTQKQKATFNREFGSLQDFYLSVKDENYIGTVRRLGLSTYRMAMIFSVLRILETGDLPETLICEDQDLQNAITIAKTLVLHAGSIYDELPREVPTQKRPNQKEQFLNKLPHEFNRQKYLKVARELGIPDKTAEGYITKFLDKTIHRDRHNHYVKMSSDKN